MKVKQEAVTDSRTAASERYNLIAQMTKREKLLLKALKRLLPHAGCIYAHGHKLADDLDPAIAEAKLLIENMS